MSNQPAHKIRVGNLQVTIWRNINREKGTTWYSQCPGPQLQGRRRDVERSHELHR